MKVCQNEMPPKVFYLTFGGISFFNKKENLITSHFICMSFQIFKAVD